MLKYTDDILTIVAPRCQECEENLLIITTTCAELGVPLAADKVEGPSTCQQILGIELDTCTMEMRLPKDKLVWLKETILQWQQRKSARKRALLSLIGQLIHVTKVVIPGQIFLHRMITLSTVRPGLNDRVRLNREFRSDLAWSSCFLERWNARSML